MTSAKFWDSSLDHYIHFQGISRDFGMRSQLKPDGVAQET